MSPTLVKATVAGDNWKEVWDHPQIIAELTAEPVPPTPGEILPYEFEHDDTTTIEMLHTINAMTLERTMRDHVLATKNQERSRMHPRLSPFTLRYHDKDTSKAVVVNSKGDRAFTFKIKDIKLECEGTNFDLTDRTTYTTLCTLNPALLWGNLQDTLRNHQGTEPTTPGPFKVELNNDATKSISFLSPDGTKWKSTLSAEHSTSPTWEVVSRGLKRPPQSSNTDLTQDSPTSRKHNRFSILVDDHEFTSPPSLPTTSPTPTTTTINIPQHFELAKQDTDTAEDTSDGGTPQSTPTKVTPRDHSCGNPTHTTGLSAPLGLSSQSDPHAHTDGVNGQYLINVEFQLIPGQEHIDTLFQKMRELLQYIQQADPTAVFLSRTSLPDGSPHPSLTSPADDNWPTTFLSAQNWVFTSTDYLFKLPPITEKQLQARLTARQRRANHNTEPPPTKATALAE